MTDIDLTNRDIYTNWCKEHVRYGDLDPVGHANNVSFAVYFETGRVNIIKMMDGFYDNNQDTAIVQLNIRYIKELKLGAQIDVGAKIGKIGNSSVEILSGLFSNGECVATAYGVVVMFHRIERKSIPIPDYLRQQLIKFQ